MQKSHSLVYRALEDGEIRVLRLKPGRHGEQLEGSFDYLSLSSRLSVLESRGRHDQKRTHQATRVDWVDGDVHVLAQALGPESYEAVSYAWGSSNKPRRLSITVGNDVEQLAITESLYLALQRFRLANKVRSLWADAVCINQEDLSEKSSQVAIMGDIYRAVARTLVWLGESTGCEYLAFAFLNDCPKSAWEPDARTAIQQQYGTRFMQLSPRCSCCSQRSWKTPVEAYIDALKALGLLCERSWFRRLWVVQEITLGNDSYWCCGSHSAPKVVITDCNDHPGGTIMPMSVCHIKAAFPLEPFDSPDLVSLLETTSELECSNHLDRVYALRAITQAHVQFDLSPDYTPKPWRLFGKVLRWFLFDDNAAESYHLSADHVSCSLLALATTTHSSHRAVPDADAEWPSWVPDFTCLAGPFRDRLWSYRWGSDSIMLGGALPHGPLLCRSDCPADDKTLVLGGRCFARVSAYLPGSQLPAHPEENEFSSWVRECSEFLVGHNVVPAANAPWQNVSRLLQLLRDYAVSRSPNISQQSESEASLDGVYRVLHETPTGLQMTTLRDRRLARIQYYEDPTCTFISWIPSSAEVGDELCTVYGAPHPFLLRRLAERRTGETYELLGDAYVDGLTDDMAYHAGAYNVRNYYRNCRYALTSRDRQEPIHAVPAAAPECYDWICLQ